MDKRKIKDMILILVIVFLIISLFMSFAKINTLNESVSNLQINFSNDMHTIRNDISEIYTNVDERLKKQASILSSYSVDYSVLDKDNYTAPILFTVTPKTLSDDTTVTVTIGDITFKLNRKGNVFSGYADTSIFVNDDLYPLISVTNGEKTENEYLEEENMLYLFYRYIPNIFADMTICEAKFINGKINASGDFMLDYKPSAEECKVNFEQFFLTCEADGEEIFRKDYTREIEKTQGTMVEFSEIFSIPDEYADLKYYIIAKDSLGLTHKAAFVCYYTSRDGESASVDIEQDGVDYYIYNDNGELLYKK